MDVNIPEKYYFSKEHEWVVIKENKAKIGISDYAQQKLGDITFVELPDVGKELKQFDYLSGIESVKAASDLFSPLSGKIIAVNNELEDTPELVNQSPYEKGWIAEIEIADNTETGNIMDTAAYKKYIDGLE